MLKRLLAGMCSLALTGCGGMYVPHDGEVPHGYQERLHEDGRLEVSYESYRRLTPEEACDLAYQRLEELADGREFRVTDRRMEQRDDVLRVPETVGPVGMVSTGPGPPTTVAGEMTPGYDIARTIKRCILTARMSSADS